MNGLTVSTVWRSDFQVNIEVKWGNSSVKHSPTIPPPFQHLPVVVVRSLCTINVHISIIIAGVCLWSLLTKRPQAYFFLAHNTRPSTTRTAFLSFPFLRLHYITFCITSASSYPSSLLLYLRFIPS